MTSIATLPLPDKSPLGWNNFRVPDAETKTVYEAWEVISVHPTTEVRNKNRVLGLQLTSTSTVLRDGYTGVRALPCYTQEELASMVATTEQVYRGSKVSRLFSRTSYAQDLAARLFRLPGCLPNKLGALLDSRLIATNKCQYARREWKVVLLRDIESVLTDESAKPKPRGLFFCSSGGKQTAPVQKWVVVLRGREVKSSEEGFEAFDTVSNPWLRVDEQMILGRDDLMEKMRY
ncbi:hypothetical protein F5Y15DRAFT_414513 [Xylariaceae sp. FL0016]|nr:hypothetical protein F5Y15DRAFT_414513 [Xylariaceae sp. FL0016]